jgi:Ca-activated chloride channel homolog
MGFSFEIDWKALAAVAIFIVVWAWRIRRLAPAIKPTLYYSSLQDFNVFPASLRTFFTSAPHWLECAALLCFLLAFTNPRVFSEKPLLNQKMPSSTEPATQGIAIYFDLDQSGSMADKVDAPAPDGGYENIRKIDLLKKLTRAFIQGDPKYKLVGRPSDLIGLIAFARGAQILTPLTIDHAALLDQLSKLDIVPSIDQEGTAIGYAIFKAVNLIAATRHYADIQKGKNLPAYDIKNSVIILLTDGLQDPNPLDENKRWRPMDPIEASKYAKANNVRLYIVNVDPELNTKEFEANHNQMQRAAELTGGKFFTVESSTSLADIYHAIDKLEKSTLPLPQNILNNLSKEQLPQLYSVFRFYPYLIALGLIFLAAALVLKTSYLRTIP